MSMTEGGNDRPAGRPNWTGVERAGDASGHRDDPPAPDRGAAPPPPPSAVDVLRVIADRLAALEHLVAGLAGVDPTPDANLVSALAERNEQVADALLRRVDERLTALSNTVAGLPAGPASSDASVTGLASISLRLDAIDRRLDSLETFTTSTPSWLPELFNAVAESKAPAPAASAAAPPWVAQLVQDLRALRASLAQIVG